MLADCAGRVKIINPSAPNGLFHDGLQRLLAEHGEIQLSALGYGGSSQLLQSQRACRSTRLQHKTLLLLVVAPMQLWRPWLLLLSC
jgi:hypothetical protein